MFNNNQLKPLFPNYKQSSEIIAYNILSSTVKAVNLSSAYCGNLDSLKYVATVIM